jgi:glycosyltransferase involved in cell wall biosynthesis
MSTKGVVISTCSPSDEVRGSVLRLRVLVNNLKKKDKWVYCPSLFKSGTIVVDGISVRYFPLRALDIWLGIMLFFKGWPLTNIMFQRRNIVESLSEVEEVVCHLSRTVQHSKFGNNLTVDLCESLSDNYRLRAALLPSFSIKKVFFILEARRLSEFEESLASNASIETLFISANDSLISKSINYLILPNSILSNPPKRQSTAFQDKKVIFIGQIDYEPNLYSIMSTSILLNELDQNYELHVVGSLAKSTKKKLGEFRNIIVHGFVDNLDDIVPDALCGVALIENVTGMQNKVLDYLFYGIPTLVSQDVYDGLPDGSPLLIIRDKDELRVALAMCLSLETRRNLQVRGYKYLDELNEN